MTAEAIRAQLTLVHICVAGEAIRLPRCEFQTFVAYLAFQRLMLACQCESDIHMVKRCIFLHLPGIRPVACTALELYRAVRRFLREHHPSSQQKECEQFSHWSTFLADDRTHTLKKAV
jgi:hypothetical protein